MPTTASKPHAAPAKRHPFIHWCDRNRRVLSFSAAVAVGVVVYLIAPDFFGAARFVAAYDGFTLTLLAVWWRFAIHADPERTRKRAAIEDPGRNLVLLIVLVAVVVGLVSAISILGHGPHVRNGNERLAAYACGVVGVFAGWALVQSSYIFRYAHLYWYDDNDDGQPGGLKFPEDAARPSDYDFAYFSFVIGMTFQVSDVAITDPRMRREVLFHALISFAYNTIIVAMVINVIAGLFSAKS